MHACQALQGYCSATVLCNVPALDVCVGQHDMALCVFDTI